MAVTIGTTTASHPVGEEGRRTIVRTSLGVLWVFADDGSDLECWYSDDGGATWTEDTSAQLTSTGDHSVAIDGDNVIYLIHDRGADDRYREGTLDAAHTALTWGTSVTFSGASMQRADVAGFKLGVDRYGCVAGRDSSNQIRLKVYKNGSTSGFYTKTFTDSTTGYTSIDFYHTGDGLTVQGGMPHLFVCWRKSSDSTLRFAKFTFAAGAWTAGSIRTVASSVADLAGGCFDGTRFLMAVVNTSNQVVVYSRDAADTTTTTYAATPSKAVKSGSAAISYDGDGDIYVAAVDSSTSDIVGVVYDRAGAAWGSWSTIEAADGQEVTLQKGFREQKIEAVWRDGTGSPYNVDHETAFTLNQPPTAATWVTASGSHDRDEMLLVDWDFQDPDTGDSQSAYALSRVVNGGSTEYWDASGGTWGGSETKNVTSTTSVTLASGWAADGDTVVYKVKTWDALDTEGVYSAALNVTASVQVNPSIDTPTDLSTISANTVSMTWTVAEQTAYRARLYNAAGSVTLEDSGWKTSATTTYNFASILSDDTDYQVGIVTRNAEGLASDEDTHTFSVDFVPPPTPTLTVTADGDHIDVAISNPTPSGPEPALTGNDLYVRIAAGGTTDGYRPVGGDGIRIATGIADDGSHVDWAASDGVDHEYLCRAFGDNGTSTDSAWTG